MNNDLWLKRIAIAGAVATSLTGALELGRALTGRNIIPEGVSPVRFMEPWQTVVVILLGLGLLAFQIAPRRYPAKVFASLVGAVAFVLAMLSLLTHAWPAVVAIPTLHETRPLGGITITLAGVALLLSALGRGTIANIAAMLVAILGAIVGLGIIYGGELFMRSESPQVSVAAALASVLFGFAVVAGNGPSAWPTRKFLGEDVPAILVRWFLPFVVLAVLLTDFANIYLFSGFPRALGSALNTILSMALAGVVISNVGRIIGGRLERSHAALRESEEKFRRLFTGVPAALAVSRAKDGLLIDVNDEFTRIFGFERDRAVGRTSIELGIWRDNSERLRLAEALKGNDDLRDMELAMRAQDGRHLSIRAAAHTLQLNGEQFIIMSLLDITARREAERQYRQLVEGVRDIVFSLAPDRTITTLNPAFTNITGFDATEWIGRPFSDLLHPEDRARALQELNASLAGRPTAGPPVRIRTTTAYIDGDIHTAPHKEAGEIISILGICRDVSERTALEEQLRQSQKMEAVGRLAGGIAHDFNNLLTVIIGSGEVALATMDDSSEERADVQEMVTAGQRAAEMTRQLLAFSRRQVLEPRDIDLNVTIAKTRNMLRRLIGEDIALVTDTDPDLGIIHVDPGQLEQVIMNLALNARDAMPNGGTITLATSNEAINREFMSRHPGAKAGAYVRLSVRDTGAGIKHEDLTHIFEPFFTTKPGGEGTGLGLAIVHGIVEQSGGYLAVSTRLGEGTTFDVYLPRVDDVASPSITASQTGPMRGSETVLVVEDNQSVRTLTSRILRNLGYTVLEAASGAEALSIAKGYVEQIDLIVSDVVMPHMSGRAMMDAMQMIRPGVKVLFVSGYPDEVLGRHGVLEKGFSLLPKPFTPDSLGRKVREVLRDGHRPRRN